MHCHRERSKKNRERSKKNRTGSVAVGEGGENGMESAGAAGKIAERRGRQGRSHMGNRLKQARYVVSFPQLCVKTEHIS